MKAFRIISVLFVITISQFAHAKPALMTSFNYGNQTSVGDVIAYHGHIGKVIAIDTNDYGDTLEIQWNGSSEVYHVSPNRISGYGKVQDSKFKGSLGLTAGERFLCKQKSFSYEGEIEYYALKVQSLSAEEFVKIIVDTKIRHYDNSKEVLFHTESLYIPTASCE
jgi:hypothetical protein